MSPHLNSRLIATAAVPLAMGLAFMLVWQAIAARINALDLARLRLNQSTHIAGDLVTRIFESTDLTLVATAATFNAHAQDRADWSRHHVLREVAVFISQADVIEAFAENGRLIAESRRHPPRQMDVSTQGFFTLHRDGGAEFNIEAPVQAPEGGPWRIPLSRRLSDSQGNFQGVLRALISSDQLSDTFRSDDNADVDRLLLLGLDGRIYADSGPRGHRTVGMVASTVFPRLASLIHPASTSFDQDPIESGNMIAATHRVVDFPFRILALRDRDAVLGSWRPFAWTMGVTAALVLMGSAIALAGYLRLERRRTTIEDSLRLRERAIATVGNGVVITDALTSDDAIIYANPAFEALTGYQAAEIIGRNPRFLHGIEADQSGLMDIREALKKNREAHVVIRNYRKDGAAYWCDLLITPVRDAAGRVTHHLGIQRDVTGQREAEERMRKANQDLAASNAELEQFAYVASHDLQEPLRMVSSYVQLLERRYKAQLDDEAREFIGYAVDGVKRMQELIVDLLEYSRITRGGKPHGRVDLNGCLNVAMADLGLAISEADATIDTTILPIVEGDANQLGRLLENLIGNALKYRAPECAPHIRISSRLKGDHWELTVADNGIGIDPQYHERIFVIFQRLHPRDRYPGTGIGLSVCRKIVERHGGRMWVESAEGQGCSFHFTLPVC